MIKKQTFILFCMLFIYCLMLKYMFQVFFPFALAIMSYFTLKPAIDYLEKHFDVHRNAIGVSLLLVIYLLLAIGLSLLIGYAVVFIIEQSAYMPTYYQQIILPFIEQSRLWLEQSPLLNNQDIFMMIQDFIGQSLIYMMTSFSALLTQIPSFLFAFFLFVISTFFLVLEYDDIKNKILSISSPRFLKFFLIIKKQSFKSLKIYLKCQFILMTLCFLILWIGFTILKLNHSFIYALCTSFLDSLPFIGVGIVLIPMCFLYIVEGMYLKALYIFLLYLMINLVRSLLEPQIMNKEMKIPSFLLLLSMVIHLHFFGIIGIILSPIHMNLFYCLLDYYLNEKVSFSK